MVNTAQQGARFERKVIHELIEHGYDCVRSAASKGAVDIVAVPPERLVNQGLGHILFIQCKLTNPLISPKERLAVQNLALRAGALPLVAWWAPNENSIHRRMTVHYRQLTGPGPKDWAPWAPGEDN